jgi:iron complex outermembrane receptor protein
MPEWKANLGVDFKLPHQSVLGVALKYVGERETIYSYRYGFPVQQFFELMTLDSYATVDVNLRVPLTDRIEAGAYVENLLDEEYEEQYGYPISGLVAGVSLKVSM